MKAKASAKLSIAVEYDEKEIVVLLEAIPLVIKKSKLDDDKKQTLRDVYKGLYDAVFPAKGRQKREVEENEFDEEGEETPARVSDEDDDEDEIGIDLPTTWRELAKMTNEEAQQLAIDLGLDNISRTGIANHLGIEIPIAKKKIKEPVYVDPRTQLRQKPGKFVKRSSKPMIRDI